MPENKKITKFKSLDELRTELEEVLALLAEARVGKIGALMPNPNLSEPYRDSSRLAGGRG